VCVVLFCFVLFFDCRIVYISVERNTCIRVYSLLERMLVLKSQTCDKLTIVSSQLLQPTTWCGLVGKVHNATPVEITQLRLSITHSAHYHHTLHYLYHVRKICCFKAHRH
jgi:hypothetical protein